MKFLIVEPSPLSILISPGPKYSLKILFSNTLSLDSSLNARDHVSQPYSTTGTTGILRLKKKTFKEGSTLNPSREFYTSNNSVIRYQPSSRPLAVVTWSTGRQFMFTTTLQEPH